MVASSRSSSPPADAELRVAALVAAIALLIGSWLALHQWFFAESQIRDTPIYRLYGNRIAEGRVPYRDFRVEYPPGSLAVFALPAVGHAPASFGTYRRIFETAMWLAGAVMLLGMAWALRALGAGPERTARALVFAGVAPLALGSVVLSRFDLWPAALCVLGLAAVLAARPRLGLGLLGAGVATKLWPGVVVPFALVYVSRRHGRRAAYASAGVFAAVVAAIFVPFVVVSPDGVWDSLSGQLTRPLQIESLGSAVVLALHHTVGIGATMRSSHGSQNLDGTLPVVLAVVQSVVQAGVLVALFVAWIRRRAPTADGLVRYSAAAVTAFVALGKVLSPQFLIWLIPLVPLVRGRRGVAASAVLGAACVLTQTWFPFRYWDLARHIAETPSWLVLARDLVLVALLVVLVWPRARGLDDDTALMRDADEAALEA